MSVYRLQNVAQPPEGVGSWAGSTTCWSSTGCRSTSPAGSSSSSSSHLSTTRTSCPWPPHLAASQLLLLLLLPAGWRLGGPSWQWWWRCCCCCCCCRCHCLIQCPRHVGCTLRLYCAGHQATGSLSSQQQGQRDNRHGRGLEMMTPPGR